jgi:DNA segregation ATPase FtsK/SpoIIIE, S-DNA-T family
VSSSPTGRTCTVEVTRPPRVPPRLPGGELVVEPPPEPERNVPTGALARLLPAVMLLGSIGFVAVLGPRNPTSWLFGGMFAISTLGMMMTGYGGRGGNRTAAIDEDRRDYLRYLGLLRRRVQRVAAEQRAVLERLHPDPAAWPAVLAAGRLWERASGDPDFGQLRIGRGDQWLAARLVPPQTGPVEGLEPITALALRRFLHGHAVVPDLPMAVSVRATGAIWLEPDGPSRDPAPARALARAMVVQYALLHAPTEALLAVIAPASLAAEWDWVCWLPHTAHPDRQDVAGPVRMAASTAEQVRGWWAAELAGRPATPAVAGPHLLIVVDGGLPGPGPWATASGVTVLRVGSAPGRRPGSAVVRLLVGSGRLHRAGTADESPTRIGRPDGLEIAEAAACARRLARFRPAGGPVSGDGRFRGAPGLPALLDLRPGPAGITALRARWSGSDADRLRVPIGIDDDGRPVTLDLKESAQGGSGPHGLCVGATGSGKSELLRSLVLGLAATHSPLELTLVLVDFKGGATFLDFAALPHVSAVITNLIDELALVDRMAAALTGEIHRRQELLRAAGNRTGIADYAAARQAGADLPPLPALLVVVDEFAELLAQRPELIDLLVTIGRIGRSLGLHLLLASQRLDEGRMRGLESHLSYRITLRTFSAAESRAVLGVPDAHRLAAPGSAFLAAGSDELVGFQATFVSGPSAVPSRAAPPAARPRAVLLPAWPGSTQRDPGAAGTGRGAADPPTDPIGLGGGSASGAAAGPAEPGRAGRAARCDQPDGDPSPGPGTAPAPTVLQTMITAMARLGPPAHRVWLPPLDQPPPLDEVLGPVAPLPGRGLGAERGTPLQVHFALVDRPLEQCREVLGYDLTGPSGHLAVVGGPQSGKSTALSTVVLGLALTSTPTELGVHVLDFGGGALAALAGLPSVGTVADAQQPELVRRLVTEFEAVLARREREFREAAVTSVAEFRARRAAADFPDEPATDLLLVVDGYLTLRSDFDDLEARLLPIAAKGLSYGLHLAVSANRWSELRPALKDLLGERVELRLGDPLESEIDRRLAAAVPARPGHGLAPDGSPMVLAAPCTRESEPSVGALVSVIAGAWAGPGFAAVRLLPDRVLVDELPGGGGAGIPLGVDERHARVDHDFAAEPHLFCLGDAECGKTALLRLLAQQLCARFTPEQARIVAVDPRRTLLDAVPASHLIGHTCTATATADAVGEIAESLRRRLPGPAVSARALRERSWWTGPELYLLVDDYDLVGPGGAAVHPLAALVEFLPQAKDVGLHVVVARRCGGAARALFDPLLGRLRELGAPALVMSGSPDEGPLLEAVKPAPQPPGRGLLVDRRRGTCMIQLAWWPPDPGAGT